MAKQAAIPYNPLVKEEPAIVPKALRSKALGKKRSKENATRMMAAEMLVICNALVCFNDKCP